MKDRSRTHRGLAALATYCLISGASFLLLLRICERCGGDNAYLGELFLGLILLLMGLVFGLTWFVTARREGRRGLAAGAVPGVAFGAVIVALGATRMFVPPALSVIELLLLAVLGAMTVAFSRVDERPTRSTRP